MTDQPATDVAELDEVAARALAAIILERTADAMVEDGSAVEQAIMQLVDDTGLALDVCVGVLTATSALVGIAQCDAQLVFAASLALDPTGDDHEGVDDGAAAD